MNQTVASRPARTTAELFKPIVKDLEIVERILQNTIESSKPGVARLLAHLAHYRGKRLRPALLLLTGMACGEVNRAHHVLAAVVEMIHTATLVHDDVLDDASVRRHVATVNAGWGNQISILLGDYLFTHAFHLTSTLGDARACELIGEATNRLCAGELHQVCERGNLNLSEEAYFDIIDGKTAALTSCCCRLGAIHGGVDAEGVERLASYGSNLGMAFQIADDVLDLVGEERSAGKSLGTDLEQQKLTLPLIHLMRQTSNGKSAWLREMLESPTRQKCERLRRELEDSGAIAYARGRAQEFASQAASELDVLPSSDCKAILEHLTRSVVNRDS